MVAEVKRGKPTTVDIDSDDERVSNEREIPLDDNKQRGSEKETGGAVKVREPTARRED